MTKTAVEICYDYIEKRTEAQELIAIIIDYLSQGCQIRGPRDDSEITNEFRQYCNRSLSNKRLKPRSQATLERYKFLSLGDNFTDAGKVTTLFFGDRSYFGLHYRDRCPEKW